MRLLDREVLFGWRDRTIVKDFKYVFSLMIVTAVVKSFEHKISPEWIQKQHRNIGCVVSPPAYVYQQNSQKLHISLFHYYSRTRYKMTNLLWRDAQCDGSQIHFLIWFNTWQYEKDTCNKRIL